MAVNARFADLKERVHSDTWWRIKTGWTDADLLYRKNALLTMLRQVWPDSRPRDYVMDFSDTIEPLVATFNDKAWCLPGQQDRTLIFAEQLRLYNEWAKHIFEVLPMMRPNEVFIINCPIISAYPLLANNTFSPTPLVSSPAEAVTSMSNSNVTVNVAPPSDDAAFATTPFNWDDVEVYVDSRLGSGAEYIIPMTKLRSGKPGETCFWYDFTLDKLFQYLKEEVQDEQIIKGTLCTIYWIRKDDWISITDVGEYQIMLKRFSLTPNTNGVLKLHLEKPPNVRKGPKHISGNEGCLKR